MGHRRPGLTGPSPLPGDGEEGGRMIWAGRCCPNGSAPLTISRQKSRQSPPNLAPQKLTKKPPQSPLFAGARYLPKVTRHHPKTAHKPRGAVRKVGDKAANLPAQGWGIAPLRRGLIRLVPGTSEKVPGTRERGAKPARGCGCLGRCGFPRHELRRGWSGGRPERRRGRGLFMRRRNPQMSGSGFFRASSFSPRRC